MKKNAILILIRYFFLVAARKSKFHIKFIFAFGIKNIALERV